LLLQYRTYVRIVTDMLVQRSFEELGTPLSEVTFCVVDLETTGGSPAGCSITEVGAVKVRRGEVMGTFQTLVRPEQPVPAFIRLLTGISDEMLIDAPAIESVLPTFLEFAGNTVLVAHNARFDVSFLNAACERNDYPRLPHQIVDTAALARRVLAGEVPNRKLETLARHLRCAHKPNHRAYTDALATVDVLHHLIERLSGFGVVTLDDLLSISYTRMDGTFSKIRLAEGLPNAIGVYRFLGATGATLYVGKASDLKARVRSYFYGDPRRKIRNLLRETQSVTYKRYATTLEAEVAETRAIAREKPPYNRSGKKGSNWYLKVAPGTRTPKVSAVRVPKEDRAIYMGPFASRRVVVALIEGLRDAARIHRCGRPERCGGCAFSEMGTCVGTNREDHRAEVSVIARGIISEPNVILDQLTQRMARLAAQERFEEAAEVRDRGAALERVLNREARVRALLAAREILIETNQRALLIRDGVLVKATDSRNDIRGSPLEKAAELGPARSVLTPEVAAEARLLASWLERHAHEVRLLKVAGTWAVSAEGGGPTRFQPSDAAASD
jgi:DNA polymerase III subunit epsilon